MLATMYTTYILYSEKIDHYYTGYTNDIARRLLEHNRKKGKYTDRGIPWKLVYSEEYEKKEDAQHRETEIKSHKSRQYIIDLIQ